MAVTVHEVPLDERTGTGGSPTTGDSDSGNPNTVSSIQTNTANNTTRITDEEEDDDDDDDDDDDIILHTVLGLANNSCGPSSYWPPFYGPGLLGAPFDRGPQPFVCVCVHHF
jgi:hypothetical protein